MAIAAALDELGDQADALCPLYITVDPERDTPTALREFLRPYPRFTGLTGSTGEIERAKAEFRVFARRRPDSKDSEGYLMPHSAITYLLSPSGRYTAHYHDILSTTEVASRIRSALDSQT